MLSWLTNIKTISYPQSKNRIGIQERMYLIIWCISNDFVVAKIIPAINITTKYLLDHDEHYNHSTWDVNWSLTNCA